jgi:glutamyl-tRNA synthetase
VLADVQEWSAASIETTFKEMATARAIKVGELQLPLRLMLVGGKFGPAVFDIAALIGKASTIARIKKGLESLA